MKAEVCILTTAHPPFDTRIFHKQAKTLVQASYDVTLIAQHDKNEVVDGVKIIALPKPRNRLQRMLFLTLRSFLLALQRKADIYHFHDPELLPAGVLLKLFTSKRVIYDVHEDYPQAIRTKSWLPRPFRVLIAIAFSSVERFLVRFLNSVITATEEISRRFPKQKTMVVKNYPLIAFAKDIHSKGGEGKYLGQKDHVLIYVGELLTKIRGIYELVKVLELIDEKYKIKLKLLGKFSNEGFERQVRTVKGFAKVDFLGLVPYKEVYQHLQEADIGLVCIHSESRYQVSLPVKLFEYMAAGLSVIASNFPLWKEIVEGNECGLTVDPLNPQEIAGAIEYLLEHLDLRQKMGENGRRAVREKYNWENESRKLLKIYKSI